MSRNARIWPNHLHNSVTCAAATNIRRRGEGRKLWLVCVRVEAPWWLLLHKWRKLPRCTSHWSVWLNLLRWCQGVGGACTDDVKKWVELVKMMSRSGRNLLRRCQEVGGQSLGVLVAMLTLELKSIIPESCVIRTDNARLLCGAWSKNDVRTITIRVASQLLGHQHTNSLGNWFQFLRVCEWIELIISDNELSGQGDNWLESTVHCHCFRWNDRIQSLLLYVKIIRPPSPLILVWEEWENSHPVLPASKQKTKK